MTSGLVRTRLFAVRPARLSGDSEVLHAGEGVRDASPDLLVGLVVRLLPVGRVFAFAAAVGHDESGARTAAVGERECLADGGRGTGPLPCAGIGPRRSRVRPAADFETGMAPVG